MRNLMRSATKGNIPMIVIGPIWLVIIVILLFAKGKSGEDKWLERKRKEHIRLLMDAEQQEWNERNIRQPPKYRGIVLALLFTALLVIVIQPYLV
jgi:hypothetical protein